MQLSQGDKHLLDIVETAGEIALDSLSNYTNLKPPARGIKRRHFESSIRDYVYRYRDIYNEVPSNSIFKETIDWYVDWAFHDQTKYLSNRIRDMMMDLIVRQVARYRRESYERAPEYALSGGDRVGIQSRR